MLHQEERKHNTEKVKYHIHTLSIKEDTSMTRIYSVVYPTNFFNHKQPKNESFKEGAPENKF